MTEPSVSASDTGGTSHDSLTDSDTHTMLRKLSTSMPVGKELAAGLTRVPSIEQLENDTDLNCGNAEDDIPSENPPTGVVDSVRPQTVTTSMTSVASLSRSVSGREMHRRCNRIAAGRKNTRRSKSAREIRRVGGHGRAASELPCKGSGAADVGRISARKAKKQARARTSTPGSARSIPRRKPVVAVLAAKKRRERKQPAKQPSDENRGPVNHTTVKVAGLSLLGHEKAGYDQAQLEIDQALVKVQLMRISQDQAYGPLSARSEMSLGSLPDTPSMSPRAADSLCPNPPCTKPREDSHSPPHTPKGKPKIDWGVIMRSNQRRQEEKTQRTPVGEVPPRAPWRPTTQKDRIRAKAAARQIRTLGNESRKLNPSDSDAAHTWTASTKNAKGVTRTVSFPSQMSTGAEDSNEPRDSQVESDAKQWLSDSSLRSPSVASDDTVATAIYRGGGPSENEEPRTPTRSHAHSTELHNKAASTGVNSTELHNKAASTGVNKSHRNHSSPPHAHTAASGPRKSPARLAPLSKKALARLQRLLKPTQNMLVRQRLARKQMMTLNSRQDERNARFADHASQTSRRQGRSRHRDSPHRRSRSTGSSLLA